MKKRILFLIHDLGPRGAEKVLVNLVNGMDRTLFDISVRTLFDWGPNRQALSPDVHYSSWICRDVPGNSHWMKLWTPEQIFKRIIPEDYDIIVSFLEGPCARVVGGCPDNGTKVVNWIHITMPSEEKFLEGFRNRKEAERCYGRADALVFVSGDVRDSFLKKYQAQKKTAVIYNVYESDRIRSIAVEEPSDPAIGKDTLNWCSAGRLLPVKGWKRMLKIQKRLVSEGIPAVFYLLGEGPQRKELEKMAEDLKITDSVVFAGYQMNPYAYMSRCILTACASFREGFSTMAVESLLVGTPVCSVEVGGMKELLGENGEYGIVTENDDEALYTAVRRFFVDESFRKLYQEKALERGKFFDQAASVRKAEELLLSL